MICHLRMNSLKKNCYFATSMNKLLLLAALFYFAAANAQYFSGEITIRDKSTYYLNQIYVTNVTAHKTVHTDHFGTFKIAAKAGDVIRFTSIVTDRLDVKVTHAQLEQTNNLVELKVAFYDIKEVVINKFKPSGNLRKDVGALKIGEKAMALQKAIGLPGPTGDGQSPELPVVGLSGGGITFSIESIFDIISGERKRKEQALQYERMLESVKNIKNYYGESYFINMKIPVHLIDNFLQFVYSSDHLYPYVQNNNYEAIAIHIEKYLPIFQRRLQNSRLMELTK